MAGQSIAYLGVTHFGALIARKADRSLAAQPLVLFDDGGRVTATDAMASHAGVALGMTERQAVARCPLAVTRPAARYPIAEAQNALMERVSDYTDRWQPVGLGVLYLDATPAAAGRRHSRQRSEAASAMDAGKGADAALLAWCESVRTAVRRLGVRPMLGATGSKFGAEVAAQVTGEGSALWLAPPAQREFLAPRSVRFLSLDSDALDQLRYLGIRTLGQFAHLPSAGVLARLGPAGRMAQRWAVGLDDRPVVPPWEAPEVQCRIELDGPSDDRNRLLALLTRHADRLLAPVRARFQVFERIALVVTRTDGRVVPASYTFAVPTAADASVRLGLAAALDRVMWEDQAATEISLTLSGITDAPGLQMSLFGFRDQRREALNTSLDRLSSRFGSGVFKLAALTDPENPLPERRISLSPWR